MIKIKLSLEIVLPQLQYKKTKINYLKSLDIFKEYNFSCVYLSVGGHAVTIEKILIDLQTMDKPAK